MDLEDSRHRSISQTSLHSSYQAHERLSDISRLRPPSQLRRPYQSLNETSALLRSPGPLESMLKTTTETGDIGIFSIKPPTPSIGHRHPRRPRPEVRVQKRPSRSHPKGFQDGPGRDDRKSLPSYRDTTSEIISLYGSRSVLSIGLINPEALAAITSILPYRCDPSSVGRRPRCPHIHLLDHINMAQDLVAQEHQAEYNTGVHGLNTDRQAPATKVFGQPV
ncbi:hypothetical protein NCS56_00573500 [Fusarium sp. Ph1]|nr:hypothetical protein NCS56_00573500 [Fusarium sp. Ph1]